MNKIWDDRSELEIKYERLAADYELLKEMNDRLFIQNMNLTQRCNQLETREPNLKDFTPSKMTICGMNCDQVHELKHFWMRHHEELPK